MLSNKYIATLWFALAMLALVPLPANGQTILFEDFEAGWGSWSADNGVWGVGVPTIGPPSCHAGSNCAGTVLDGYYPSYTDSRLISPTVTLPAVVGSEEIHLLFNSWFAYWPDLDRGYVQVSSFDGATWSAWETVGGDIGVGDSPAWSLTGRDLTAYAGETIQIAFYHTSDTVTVRERAGWYVDDVQIIKRTPSFGGDFESGWGDWYSDNGVWGVGVPTIGPPKCHAGSNCAGTVLDGYYPSYTDSRLISPTVTLPAVVGGEEIHLLFNSWFAYWPDLDRGYVQVSSFDGATWSAWETVGGDIGVGDSPAWSLTGRDLTAYEGETIRVAFYHTSDTVTVRERAGWYVDDVQIIKRTPSFGGDFESGWGDWYSDNGLWEVGVPTIGPPSCNAGSNCAGTILDGYYPSHTDSRLISPSITLSRSGNDPINLRFFHWFAYWPDLDHGEVQVSSFNSTNSEWSVWSKIGGDITNSSSGWSPTIRDLTDHAGETIRIAFYHTSDTVTVGERAGWYIDDIEITGIVMDDDVLFKDGFE